MPEKSAKKKTREQVHAEEAADRSLEQMVLDKKSGKYEVVPLIAVWAKDLRKQEEHRHLTQNEILELAMSEVLSGKVSEKDLAKRAIVQRAEAAADLAEEKKKAKSS